MNWGGKLFTRMFLGFWLVTVTILATWVLAARYFDQHNLTMPDGGIGAPPQRALLQLFYDLQQLERPQLRERLEQTERRYRLHIFVLDEDNRELLGREPPPPVRRMANQLQESEQRRIVLRSRQGSLLGQRLYRRDTGPLRVIVHFPPPRPGLRLLGENPWLRVLLAVGISGLVCFWLSRLITGRIKALQQASRQLAQGQLDTRITVRDRGGDETDELARDFNSMAAQLQERIVAQKQLLSDVSHELRSPLARLRIALALAQEDPGDGIRHLARIEQEAERLEELIAQLLASGEGAIDLPDHLDLGVLLDGVCRDASFEGEPEGKSVAYTAPAQPALVSTRGDLLKKCFENLLRNAVQHTSGDSVVSVTARLRGDHVDVQIQDRGPGVPAAELARIFDAFYRVDRARSRDRGGYGLGLSIARRAVLQHGGEIFAENTGDGLRVTVSLPLAERDQVTDPDAD